MNYIAKPLSAIALAIALPFCAMAQNVIDVHPANNEGQLMTMRDAVSGRLTPRIPYTKVVRDSLEYFKIDMWGEEPDSTLPSARTYNGSIYCTVNGSNPDSEVAVAVSYDKNIRYGEVVSRNEFGIEGGLFWSPGHKKLAFYRKDESKVTEFPLLDIKTRTGSLNSIKYPMNGMDSERISLGVYDVDTRETVYLKIDDFDEERYLTNVSWGPDSKNIFVLVLDRSQKRMRLNQYRSDDGSFVRTILTEDNYKYVEPQDPLAFIGDRYHFIYRTNNRDGYFNLYLCDTLGTVRRITNVDADVALTSVTGNTVFYTSAEVSPVENHLFRVDINLVKGKKGASAASAKIGKPLRLTRERGWHNVIISKDGKNFFDRYSSFNVPIVYQVLTADGKGQILWKKSTKDPLASYKTGEVEFGTVKSADGKYDNYYRLFKPVDFDPSKKYPVVVYVYGGPHSQMVTDSWLGKIRMWEMLMSQKGYVVYVMDNRGTENRGQEYEQAIHRHCGRAEMQDQMEGVKMLCSKPWVDSSRIGVHGWSYGGFMTISLMTTYPDVFKVGVAGGPVIDWKWYEVMYGERYMETEKTNPNGFAQTSLINKAKNLKGKLLICQGANDKTCVWEHSLSFIQECIDYNIPVDYFPYPVSDHNVIGPNRVHLMDKVTAYFEDYLNAHGRKQE